MTGTHEHKGEGVAGPGKGEKEWQSDTCAYLNLRKKKRSVESFIAFFFTSDASFHVCELFYLLMLYSVSVFMVFI
jgi:hypothetical protein